MKLSKEMQAYNLELVKGVVFRCPELRDNARGVQRELAAQAQPVHLSDVYIRRLLHKLQRRRLKAYQCSDIRQAISGLEESITQARKVFIEIAYDENSTARDKMAALRAINESMFALLELKRDAGIFQAQPVESEYSEAGPEPMPWDVFKNIVYEEVQRLQEREAMKPSQLAQLQEIIDTSGNGGGNGNNTHDANHAVSGGRELPPTAENQ